MDSLKSTFTGVTSKKKGFHFYFGDRKYFTYFGGISRELWDIEGYAQLSTQVSGLGYLKKMLPSRWWSNQKPSLFISGMRNRSWLICLDIPVQVQSCP